MSHTYRIETMCPVRGKWIVMLCWWGMPKGRAEGAFMVLRAGYGGSHRYRLIKVPLGGDRSKVAGEVVEEYNTGEVVLS